MKPLPARDAYGNRFAATRNFNKFTLWSWNVDGRKVWAIFPPYGGPLTLCATWDLAITHIEWRINHYG